MSRDKGPPDENGGPWSPHQKPAALTNHRDTEAETRPRHHPHSNASGRQCSCGTPPRRFADAWRSGFTAGAVDALRRAERWLPPDPDLWAILEDLTTAYTLAGGDD
jgi:hypothetical protein